MADSNIVLTQLDFNEYKNSLKTFLQSQTEFQDYDFEASNMSVLLDVLAYNTYQNAFYLQMVANEMFLDSARLRDSIVSHAKELNYLPRSFTSAKAQIQLAITPPNTTAKNSLVLPKGSTFVSRVEDRTFTFSTIENIVIANNQNGTFISDAIDIYEGNYLSDTFVIDYDNPLVFKLSNKTIDISSLNVTVIEDNGAVLTNYDRATSLFGHSSASTIYFVQAASGDLYEIVFGDGVIGNKPKNGAVVIVQYRISSGQLPNGAYKFINTGQIDGESNVAITTLSSAIGGEVAEDSNSIKYNAPRAFTTQERAITSEDYENLLKINYPEINAVTAYGGEDAIPPQYGRIFVSIDLKDVDGLPRSKQDEYTRFLRTRSSVAMEPVFISPDYIYLDVVSNIKYNINKTALNPQDIRTLVVDAILNHASDNLNNFAKTFRYSKLVRAIDASNDSIVSNETEVLLTKYLTPQLNVAQTLSIDFKIPLADDLPPFLEEHASSDIHCVESTAFTYSGLQNCFLEDDGNGNIRIVSKSGSTHKTLTMVGKVDYAKGLVTLSQFNISSFNGTSLKVYARSKTKDIIGTQNMILNIIEPDITVNIEQIRE